MQLRDWRSTQSVLAIGEIGLDYYWVPKQTVSAMQREALQGQLAPGGELGKPVILHMREQMMPRWALRGGSAKSL